MTLILRIFRKPPLIFCNFCKTTHFRIAGFLNKCRNGSEDTFKGLQGILSDVNPDKFGNSFIHSFIHGCYKNGRTECSMNPVEKLGFNIEFDRLLDKAKCILSSRESFHTKLNSEDEKSMRKIFSIGTRVAKDLKIQCRLRKKTTTKTAKKSQSKQFQC